MRCIISGTKLLADLDDLDIEKEVNLFKVAGSHWRWF